MEAFDIILYFAFSVLVFPGLLFITALALFTQYLVRKLSGRFQKRLGPTYVGPMGVFQPLYDLLKLLRVKEVVKSRYSMVRVAEVSLLLGISFIIGAMILFPLSPFHARGPYDFFIFFYMSSVIPVLVLLIASVSMPNPYTSLGVSRLLTLITLSEPSYFTALLVPVMLSTWGTEGYMSIEVASARVLGYWSNPISFVILAISIVAAIISVQAKSMYPPFNIPEAEQELIAGFETEFSGPLLALASLLHDLEVTIALLAIIYLFLGGPAPFNHLSIGGVAMLVIKYFLVVFLIALIKNVVGRYKIEQALEVLFKYALIPSVISLILLALYLYL